MHIEGSKSTEEIAIDIQDLTCPICMSIASDPQISSCCHRIFCMKDADINQYNNGCPLCRERKFSFQSSSKHKDLLDKLTIQCACSEHVAPNEYETHLERCSNVSFPCPHKVCQEKNDSTKYNSQQLINHIARFHCNEVSLLGSTYIKKKSVESYKKSAMKYEKLVLVLYGVIYPKMIDSQMKHNKSKLKSSSTFKCPSGHQLIEADRTKRKRKNGLPYASIGYNCDVCHQSISDGVSWHCSCAENGFDKCISCLVFQLYNIDNDVLKLASRDQEKQHERYRRETIRNIVRLPHGLFRLLTRTMDDGDDDDDDDDVNDNGIDDDLDLLALRHRSPYLLQQSTTDEGREADHREN